MVNFIGFYFTLQLAIIRFSLFCGQAMKKNRKRIIILFTMTVLGFTAFFSGCYRCILSELLQVTADVSESITNIIQILLLRKRLISKSPNKVV
ncbi:hypothetical protein CUN60_08550 [Aquella oligotrophica]|uniref:Uncharacterized protein n=1 Tax=Aquella oligotrophica TaxID=2067065 RepID=A0A2I7N793_9NEIS|nr:hypothetical protein CUN60_08550 [Aquella oligotrophica]